MGYSKKNLLNKKIAFKKKFLILRQHNLFRVKFSQIYS